jgi:predicted Zn-ribbon and HTH transcriptional regulator
MKVQCKNCLENEAVEIPDFTQSEKKYLLELNQKSPLHTVKYLIDNFKASHRDAKYMVTHISIEYGRCKHCIFDNLDEEYIKCPKCGALNFNWKIND